MMKNLLTLFCLLGAVLTLTAQEKSYYQVYSIAFYNIENLFDTEDDPDNPGDDEFLPNSVYRWTNEKYEKKLDHIAGVISRLGRELTPHGPAVIGIAEVENRRVLEDLVKRPAIAEMNLQIVHEDSPDRRGIDVALLYNPKLFTLTGYALHPYHCSRKPWYVSRDQLVVSGILANEKVSFSVNHWPSRYSSKSSELREAAAENVNMALDSLFQEDLKAKVIIMGDLNDDPTDRSLRQVLNAKKRRSEVKEMRELYNPMWHLYDLGIGSLAYQGKWSLFDQMVVTGSLLNEDVATGLRYWRTEIFNRKDLMQQEGPDKGYPLRTFNNNTFINGYSDHFPVLIYLTAP
ncbi:MAG: endonuclease/exonuclease/phosphatase family protein [Proteiniphilum sp.]|nr:endonuclease/exonuclease/phosphatase family protein [Proteiniphilum sp.]